MNKDLGKTQITKDIRVSSAAIFYKEWFGDYYQYETWIFSSDSRLKPRQFTWGTSGGEISEKLKWLTENAHRRIAKIMKANFN
jgi:hypothetical protein